MVLLESLNLPLGSKVEDFNLPGIDDRNYSLMDFEQAKILVIVFMCNHCPYVQAIWNRLIDLQKKYKISGVQFVGINPNFHPDYPEDSMEKMKEYYQKYEMNFPYLQDKTQEVAKRFKAQCTPDIYVYDENRELAYHGRVDDNWQDESAVKKNELDDALGKLIDGNSPNLSQNPCMGCSIKWRE